MNKYIKTVFSAIFVSVNLCVLHDVVIAKESINDTKADEIEIMLKTLEQERAVLDKLKSELKENVLAVTKAKEGEKKRNVVFTNFKKKGDGKKEKPVDNQKSSPNDTREREFNDITTLEVEAEVVEDHEKVTADKRDEPIHPFEIAENLYKLGEYKSALDIYQLIMKNNITKDKKLWISYQIANCYRKLGVYDKAVESYRTMQEEYEGSYWSKQAQWYIQDIEWRDKVEEKLKKIIER